MNHNMRNDIVRCKYNTIHVYGKLHSRFQKIIENGDIRFNLFVGENNYGKDFWGKKDWLLSNNK